MVFGCQGMVLMEINLGIPADYCQGEAMHFEYIDIDEISFPPEDKRKLKAIKVGRERKHE